MYNRYVDRAGTWAPEDAPDIYRASGKRLAGEGYMNSTQHPSFSQKQMRRPGFRISPEVRKTSLIVFVTIAVAYAAFASTILWAMRQPPETFARVMAKMPGPIPFLLFPFETAWTHSRAGRLRVGEPAPDFSLMTPDKSARVRLSTLNATKPVVLIFGSYT
jgi:hypothetical protein